MPWRTIFFMVALGMSELTLSWLNHKINIFVLQRKAWEATKYDLLANSIAETMPYFIYVLDPQFIYLIPKIAMNTLGTFLVGSRKINGKKPAKRPIRKKIPKDVTTA